MLKQRAAGHGKEYTAICGIWSNDETRMAVRHILKHNILSGDALTMMPHELFRDIFVRATLCNFVSGEFYLLSINYYRQRYNFRVRVRSVRVVRGR